MRKKELRVRNDQLRRELLQAHQLSASQVKQINQHRMELAILSLERPPSPSGSIGVGRAFGPGERCPTCGQVSAGSGTAEPALKACPDCAEAVNIAARKCRYCGYRFDGVDRTWTEGASKEGAQNGSASIARLGKVSGT